MEFSFTDNLVVEKLDGVPKDFHGLYTEADGKYRLNSDDPTVGSAVKAIVGLNKALTASRAEARDAKGRVVDLSSLSEFGDSPDKILQTFQAKLEEAQRAAKGKGNEDKEAAVKAAQEALRQAHAKELEKHEARTKALTSQLYNRMVSSEATQALAEAQAINPAVALPLIERQVKVIEEDGQFMVRVVNEKGEERFSGTTGAHMTIKELVAEMKGDEGFQFMFKSDAPQGGGRQPGGVPGVRQQQRQNLSATDKIAMGLSKGQASKK